MIGIARWLLLAIILLAPWPYGSVPAWARPLFTESLLGTLGIWLLGLLLKRRPPTLPKVLLLALGWLAFHGLLLIGNSQYWYNRVTFEFISRPEAWGSGRWVPGALDVSELGPLLLQLAGVAGALCILVDMVRIREWRLRLVATLLAGGLAVVLFGVAQRVLHNPLGLWGWFDGDRNYFGPFLYHGNAGAFVNLMLAGLAGWVVLEWSPPRPTWRFRRWLAAGALVLTLAATVVIASKAAMVLGAGLVLLSGWLFMRLVRRHAATGENTFRWSPLWLAVAAAVLLCLPLLGYQRAQKRWAELPASLGPHNPRLLAWQACLRMLPDAGPWGIGPGNFQFAFPHYTYGLSPEVAGFWQFAHEDYLQTAIEWGWLGFAAWGVVIGGGLLRRHPGGSLEGEAIRLAARLALGGILVHALLDYPLQIPAIQLYFAGWLAFLWAGQARGTETNRKEPASLSTHQIADDLPR